MLATVMYFLTLVVVRLVTTLTRPSGTTDIEIGGTHIHHLVFGIIALLLAGGLALDESRRLFRAALFGIGAALVLDEFALAVFLKDVYWLPEGSLSIVALVVGAAALAINALRNRPFIRELVRIVRGGT